MPDEQPAKRKLRDMSALIDAGGDPAESAEKASSLAPPVLVTPTPPATSGIDIPAPRPLGGAVQSNGTSDLETPIVDEHRQIAEMKAPAVRSPSGAATPAVVNPTPAPAPSSKVALGPAEATDAASPRLAPPVLKLPTSAPATPAPSTGIPQTDAPSPVPGAPIVSSPAPTAVPDATPKVRPAAVPAARMSPPPSPFPAPAARISPAAPPGSAPLTKRVDPAPAPTNGTTPVPSSAAPRVTVGSSRATGRSTMTAPINFATAERVRQAHARAFHERFGTQLDLLPFVARAVCDGLLAIPALNGNASTVHLALSTFGNHQNPASWPVVSYADYRTLSMIGLEAAMPGLRETEPTFVLATGEAPATDLATLTVRVSPTTRESDTVSLTWSPGQAAPHEAEMFIERVRTTIDTHNWAIEF